MIIYIFHLITKYCKFITIGIFAFSSLHSFSQPKSTAAGNDTFQIKVVNGDTIIVADIPAVNLFTPRDFKNSKEFQKYLRLVRNVKKVYPYAVLASGILKGIDDTLNILKTKKERKEYLDISEKRLRSRFENELKQLTITQGRILIKLVYRETGNTTYYHVKELRGTFSAFFWQALARVFGSSLKSNYDPNGEDRDIEDVIRRIQKGEI
jgi:hypothetical protein